MTDQPPRKKLKQITIMSSFEKQNSTKIEQGITKSSDGLDIIDVDQTCMEKDDNVLTDDAGEFLLKTEEKTSTVERVPEQNRETDLKSEATSFILEKKSLCKGIPRDSLRTTPTCSEVLLPLKAGVTHIVTFHDSYKPTDGNLPRPYPREFEDRWDDDHVKMPCSDGSQYPLHDKNGKTELQCRWKLIEDALKQPIINSIAFEETVLKYNKRYKDKWSFEGLHEFLVDKDTKEEGRSFFKDTLPGVARLALQLPHICSKAIPLLRKQRLQAITMSQQQVACLLANAFFCTFPRRNARGRQSEYSSFPDINFVPLFQGLQQGRIVHSKAEKLKCILQYFRRVTKSMPTGTITFRRQLVKDFPEWEKSTKHLTKLHVTAEGTIEDEGSGMLQVDFANKFIGGGVLGRGCVQEEIRFLICPELIVSRLFTESLESNECVVITGCERFSNYTGYSGRFKWHGNHNDTTQRDNWGRRCTEIVAIDAMVFHSYKSQFDNRNVNRELNKAYCGFLTPGVDPSYLSAVATGNWGCGAFGGDLKLKALIQLMAASQVGRDVCYFTFSDQSFCDQLYKIHCLLKERKLEVSDLYALIVQYRNSINKRRNLFEFIYLTFNPESIDSESSDFTEETIDCDNDSDDHIELYDSQDFAANTP